MHKLLDYERHTNGCSVSSIKIDSSCVFDKAIIEFGFIWTPFKRFTIEVKYNDIGNNTGADFSNLKVLENKIKKQSCNSFSIKSVTGMGMILVFSSEKIFIPMYDYLRGYYSNDIDMIITYECFDENLNLEEKEVTEFNPKYIVAI